MLTNIPIFPRASARLRRLAIAFAAVACSAAGAAAQGPMGPPPAEMFKKMCNDMDALFAARMAFVRTRVAPAPDQMAEWEVFVSSSRAMLGAIKANCNSPDAVPPSPAKDPVAFLIFRERGAKDRADLFKAERAAVERFMKVLSPQQRQNLGEAMLPPPHVGPFAGPMPGLPPL